MKNSDKLPPGGGPSWLTFIGHLKDSLWSVDLFRCESVSLKTHWVMVVIDQFTRNIIGFAIHVGDPDGKAYCRMFNSIISGKSLPKYLSSDNDPLYLFHRWKANLRVIDVKEIKSIPGVPQSHPFIERVIRNCRQELLNHTLFFNSLDLQRKLDDYQKYYNHIRCHSSIGKITPAAKADSSKSGSNVASIDNYRWKSHCNRLYHFPVAV